MVNEDSCYITSTEISLQRREKKIAQGPFTVLGKDKVKKKKISHVLLIL